MKKMSANVFVKTRINRRDIMPRTQWYNVLDQCDECPASASRNGCKAWEACTRKPRPHPLPKIRRVHVDQASRTEAQCLLVLLVLALGRRGAHDIVVAGKTLRGSHSWIHVFEYDSIIGSIPVNAMILKLSYIYVGIEVSISIDALWYDTSKQQWPL